MKKVLLLAMAEEREAALEALRDAGVMQIELAGKFSAGSQSAGEERDALSRAVNSLIQLTDSDDDAGAPELPVEESSRRLLELLDERGVITAEMDGIRSRLKNLEELGDFDKELLDELNASGVNVIPCLGSEEDFAKAEEMEGVHCERLADYGNRILFAVLSTSKLDESLFPVFNLSPVDNPRKLNARVDELSLKLEENEKSLFNLKRELPRLKRLIQELDAKFEFCRARDAVSDHGEILSLSGFVPEPDLEKLRECAVKEGWGICISDPGADEEVPVLIKRGNFYTRTVKPLFDFLGITPGYREIDVSGGVLFFFTIFYAIIVGDAGYGLIFLALSAFLGWKFRRDKSKRPLVALMTLLSVATIIWGALAGLWFGVEKGGIKALTDPVVKDANMQVLCFVLAVAQLSLGHMWRAIRERSWRAFGSNLGWTLIIWGNFFLAVKIIVSPGAFPACMYYLYGIGLALVVLFSVRWKDPAAVFQFPFDVIGSFTDVLSYIRLFAVGMAGASIALNFNSMGSEIAKSSPYFIIFGVLVVLIGHLLNLALCVMSVLVHAVRLNTLEFSNHSGLTWSGTVFKPFRKPIFDQEDKK